MAKDNEIDYGTIIKEHPSGIKETNKGAKCFQGEIGDKVIKRGRELVIIPKKDKADKPAKDEEIDMAKPGVLTGEA